MNTLNTNKCGGQLLSKSAKCGYSHIGEEEIKIPDWAKKLFKEEFNGNI